MKNALPIAIAVAGLAAMTLVGHYLQTGRLPVWNISNYAILNFTFTMQMMVLPISFIALALTYLHRNDSFKRFFRFSLSRGESDWNIYGPVAAVAFTLGTSLIVLPGVLAENGAINGRFFQLLPMVILLAAANSWSEEIFSRFVLVAGFDGKLHPDVICFISAIIFGAPHFFFGTPSGLFGVIASGMLGWFLAKSVVATRSMGWALLIHFLQDVAIFGSGAMIIAGS